MGTTFRRKQNRLPLEAYRGPGAYLLTLRCAAGATPSRPPRSLRRVYRLFGRLRTSAEKHNVHVVAYCFMPDHLHLLLEGTGESFIPDFVHDFKQKTGFMYQRAHSRTLWQKSYHDRVLRKEESLHDAARYIVANPVRKGLAARPEQYPYSGSFIVGEAIMEA